MIESIFYFLVLLSIGIFILGVLVKSPGFVALSGVMFILVGVILMSGESIVTSTLDNVSLNSDATDINYSYFELTTSNDNLVNMFSLLFTYGGLIPLAYGLLIYYNRWRTNRASVDGEGEGEFG